MLMDQRLTSSIGEQVKIRVTHAYFGCETGCCGHILEIDDEEDYDTFEFGHPDNVDELRAYILKHIPEECHDSIDWPSVEFDSESFNGYC